MNNLILLCILFIFVGCSATQPIRVLEEGKTKAVVSIGGPIIELGGVPVPTPYLNIGAMYGCSKNLTFTGNLHVFAAVLGDIGIDAGSAMRLVKQDHAIPEVTAKAQIYLFDNISRGPNQPRILPMITINGSYLLGESTLLYAGIDNLFESAKPVYLLSPFIGTEFYISHVLSGQIETKWVAANVNTAHGVLEGYGSIGGSGGIGLFLGLVYSF